MFMALPSKVRREFDDDPGTFLDFANDPKNTDRMIELGLVKKEGVVSPEIVKKV